MCLRWWAAAFALVLVSTSGWSQATNGPCLLDAPSLVSSVPNIFNAQQEEDLGDALAEYQETHMRVVTPRTDDQLTRIGERLLAVLPPTGVKYRFRIYESGELNAFSLAGGRVYVSRKLVAAIKNEDELAGVLAHEIGHIYTHQTAIEFTQIFRVRLGVTQVGDRADIFAKVHRMYDTPQKPGEGQDPGKEEKADQLIADRMGLFAAVRAGYAPESFVSFLDKVMLNKGKTGNWFSDRFGITAEESVRYRTAVKLIAALPAGCKGRQPVMPQAFLDWQRGAVEERAQLKADGLEGDWPVTLERPLRSSMWRIRFSLDGKYLLGQDESGISVVDRITAKVLFHIDAPDAEMAQFTPDSQGVVFHDAKLRVEKWTIATGTRAWAKELVVFEGCRQTMLSMDGRTLVCLSTKQGPGLALKLIDVESGKVFLDKPGFFDGEVSGVLYIDIGRGLLASFGSQVGSLLMSPDGRYLLVAVKYRVMAYDLVNRQPISLGGKLRNLNETRMSFLGPDQLYVVHDLNDKHFFSAEIVSFPDGHLVKETQIGLQQVWSSTNNKLLVAGPVQEYAVGLLDPAEHKFVAESKFPAIDAWEQYVAIEDLKGGILVGEVGGKNSTLIPLPLGSLPRPRAAVISSDGKYLAISLRNRSEVWDVETGKSLGLLRPFASGWIDGTGQFYAEFPKYLEKDPAVMKLTTPGMSSTELGKPEEDGWQYQNLELHFKADGRGKSTYRHATLEAKKLGTQTAVWTKDFPNEVPACWPAEDDRLVLGWDLATDGAKVELKSHPGLQQEAAALKVGRRGLLVETVTAETGVPREQVVVPEADLSGGWEDERRAIVSGGFVMVRGEHENTVIYKLDTGAKMGEFFGDVVATNASLGLIAAVNREAEISLLEEKSGKELKRFTLGSPVRVVRILGGREKVAKALLVLTADQVVHRLPLPE